MRDDGGDGPDPPRMEPMTQPAPSSPDSGDDCLVVGGGLIGMLTARELAREGWRVRILERGEAGAESSWAGGGILSPLYPWRAPEPVTRLAIWSQRHYRALAEQLHAESGIDPEWYDTGMLLLDSGEGNRARYWGRDHGVRVELPDAERVAELEPALGARPRDAVWMPEVANIRNPRLVRALRGSLAHLGVPLHEQTPVTGWLRSEGRIEGVETERGRFEAGCVILAGGAWSGDLLAGTGIGAEIRPVRGQMVVFRMSPGRVRRVLLRHDHYIIPRRDGHVLAGSTLEEAGFDKTTTEEAGRQLVRMATDLVPALGNAPVERHWAGLRPGSPEGVPLIGPHPELAGLYLNTGHYRNGVVMGPASARLLTDLLMGWPTRLEPTAYRPTAAGERKD